MKPCKEEMPELKLESESSTCKIYYSDSILIQTRKGDMFVGKCAKWCWTSGESEYDWYTYGPRGRRMRIMDKVVAWMPLPEKYEEAK